MNSINLGSWCSHGWCPTHKTLACIVSDSSISTAPWPTELFLSLLFDWLPLPDWFHLCLVNFSSLSICLYAFFCPCHSAPLTLCCCRNISYVLGWLLSCVFVLPLLLDSGSGNLVPNLNLSAVYLSDSSVLTLGCLWPAVFPWTDKSLNRTCCLCRCSVHLGPNPDFMLCLAQTGQCL